MSKIENLMEIKQTEAIAKLLEGLGHWDRLENVSQKEDAVSLQKIINKLYKDTDLDIVVEYKDDHITVQNKDDFKKITIVVNADEESIFIVDSLPNFDGIGVMQGQFSIASWQGRSLLSAYQEGFSRNAAWYLKVDDVYSRTPVKQDYIKDNLIVASHKSLSAIRGAYFKRVPSLTKYDLYFESTHAKSRFPLALALMLIKKCNIIITSKQFNYNTLDKSTTIALEVLDLNGTEELSSSYVSTIVKDKTAVMKNNSQSSWTNVILTREVPSIQAGIKTLGIGVALSYCYDQWISPISYDMLNQAVIEFENQTKNKS